MTAGDFMSNSPDMEDASTYPVVFGIKLTPMVSGLLLIVLGGAAAFWIFQNLVAPVQETNQALQMEVDDKQRLLVDTGELERQIQEAQDRLEAAQVLRTDVLGLFASEASLDTLLFDLNERIRSANAGIEDEDRQARLVTFEVNESLSGIITDSSYGPAVNNRLQRRVYDVSMRGDFTQTQSIIRSIERLQPLMVLREFNSELDRESQAALVNQQGQVIPRSDYVVINTSFQLHVLLPAPEGTFEQANQPAEGEEANGS
jgi:type IV pilus assembly protein PilO